MSLVCWGANVVRAEVLVPVGSTWKWLHSSEGVDPAGDDEDFHTTFYTADFDDSKWKSGKDKAGPHGGFGYGDPDLMESTLVGRTTPKIARRLTFA